VSEAILLKTYGRAYGVSSCGFQPNRSHFLEAQFDGCFSFSVQT
jgi:hypothetical protein